MKLKIYLQKVIINYIEFKKVYLQYDNYNLRRI